MIKLTNGITFDHCFCYQEQDKKCNRKDCTGKRPIGRYMLKRKKLEERKLK